MNQTESGEKIDHEISVDDSQWEWTEKRKKSNPDGESRMQLEDKPEVDNEERAEPFGAPSTSIRRRITVKSEPRAVTTPEAVDGYREKAMRI